MNTHNHHQRASRLLTDNLELLASVPPGELLDLACGGGRNALALAALGFSVAACDRSESSLALVKQRCQSQSTAIRCFAIDLEATEDPLQADHYGAILVFRYLHRPLMKNLREAIKSGGLIYYQTFTHKQPNYGHPKNPLFLLAHEELLSFFDGWTILHYWEGVQSSPKRAVAQIIARKP
jgi:tellurite methyltransferase